MNAAMDKHFSAGSWGQMAFDGSLGRWDESLAKEGQRFWSFFANMSPAMKYDLHTHYYPEIFFGDDSGYFHGINKNGEEFARILGLYNFNDEKFIKWLNNYN